MTIHRDMFKNTDKDLEKIEAAFGSAPSEWDEGPLKNILVEYVGTSNNMEEGGDITVEMIAETLAAEFPEFLMAIAEENWIRGYQQAIHDVDAGQALLAEHADRTKDEAENGTA